MTRYGIFGGTFDPIHVGHVILATEMIEVAGLDRLFVVPAACSPHKSEGPIAPGPLRLAMARQAFSADADVEVVDWEIARNGISYTIDTLKFAQGLFPDARWTLVLGEDSIAAFPKWKDAADIAARADLAVAGRPGSNGDPTPELRRALPGVRATLFRTTPIGVSSMRIRERAAAGRSLRGYVVDPVARAIEESGLYRATTPTPPAAR